MGRVKECNRRFDCIGYTDCLERYSKIVKVGPSDPKVNNFCDGCVAYRQKKDDINEKKSMLDGCINLWINCFSMFGLDTADEVIRNPSYNPNNFGMKYK